MDEEKFGILVMSMKAVYTKPEFLPDENAISVWYALLKDLDYMTAALALEKHMMTNPFPPTIADIRAAASELVRAGRQDHELTELEAWSLVRRAIQNSNYNSEQEYARLPDLVKQAIGDPANLRELAMMPTDTVESVEQSHFIRSFRAVVARSKELSKLNPALQELLAGKVGNEQISAKDSAAKELEEAWNGQKLPDKG